jgi:hypothetical protein
MNGGMNAVAMFDAGCLQRCDDDLGYFLAHWDLHAMEK